MKILIVSDAARPQINGVVRTLESTMDELKKDGHEVRFVGPDLSSWKTFSLPTYPDIKVEAFPNVRLREAISGFAPDAIHIATEGALGWSARRICLQQNLPFTTSYHTDFPGYFATRAPRLLQRPVRAAAYAALRKFHRRSSAVMVSTETVKQELREKKFRNIVDWSRGVDTGLFKPYGKDLPAYEKLERPILLYVGRVSSEKNLPAFLDLDTPGTKVVIGGGPDFEQLKAVYPSAHFLGPMQGEQLAHHYAAADLFVFPSVTDTFGLVLLEACASGLRVAAYPVTGPIDVFANPSSRSFVALDKDLGTAINRALALPDNPALPRAFAERFSWKACAQQFANHLQAPTPEVVKRITRMHNWLGRRWQRALALGPD